MHSGALSRLAGADAASIALDDRQFGRALGTFGQGVVGLGVGVTTLRQFLTDVMHHPLDRLGGDALAGHLLHHDGGPLERACLGAGEGQPPHQQRGQFSGVKA